MRGGRLGGSSNVTVTSLLPKETLAFVHLPDFNATRARWRETDICKLWREPAVQDFVQRPLSKMPDASVVQQKLREFETLGIKDAFFAVTAWEDQRIGLLGGFRFKGSAEDAEKIIGQWRTRLQANAPNARRETIMHEQHRIDAVIEGAITVATVYDRQWFFAANDVAALKIVLDRTDGRRKEPATTLAADENFTASLKRMPGNYAILGYGRLDHYWERLSKQMTMNAGNDEQLRVLGQLRSITAASRIENGKFRDVLFLTMPKREEMGDLSRSSLSLATTNSVLYAAGFLKIPEQMPLGTTNPAKASGFAGALPGIASILSAAGLTLEDWKNAFGPEVGIIADWVENSRWPSLAATLPVKDASKARAVVAALASGTAESGAWAESEKEGVQFYAKPPLSPMLPIAPTMGLSDRLFVLAQDPASAEAIVERSSSGSSGLTASASFKAAERLVAEPKEAFAYLDTALFYRRLDAAVRPMLVMAAAFVPRISESVELGKLPAADVVSKHLSPIVISQRYDTDGYLTESVAPISLYQAAVGISLMTGAAAKLYDSSIQGLGSSPVAVPGSGGNTPFPLPSASPSEP